MLEQKIVKKIISMLNERGIDIEYTKKFQSNDFEFEFANNPYIVERDEQGNILKKESDSKESFFYHYSQTYQKYMKIKGQRDDFFQIKYGEYKGVTFKYYIFNVEGLDFLYLYSFDINDEVLEFPDEIDGIPVLSVKISSSISVDSCNDTKSI